MAQPGSGVNSKNALVSTSDEALGFPTLGHYQILSIFRGAKWFGVASGAENKKIYDFVLIKLGMLDPAAAPSVNDPFHDKIDHTLTNFSRLFEEGKSLMQKGLLKTINLAPNISFSITSPLDLLEANLALRDLAERVIFQGLFSTQTGELTEIQRLRITQTKFLGPWTLSQMTNGQISVEDALLLITCLGLQKQRKTIQVCDPSTGNFHKNFQANMLTSQPSYKLVFLSPDELLKTLSKAAYDPDKDIEDTKILFEGTKLIAKTVLGSLEGPLSSLSLPSQRRLAKDLMDASIDHEKVLLIIDQLETYFPDEQREAVLGCKSDILQETENAFKKCRELVESLPSQEKFNDALKNIEARARLTKASQKREILEEKFSQFKEVILDYLKLLSEEYQIKNPVAICIRWIVQGTEIVETMEITKTCAVARRVLCPKTSDRNRNDLVYFSSDVNEESVVSRWKLLCQENSLSDRQLADYLLLLYQGSEVPDKLMPFLSFLIILLFGKEPAYDSASFAANFILLISVKSGVHTFEEALSRMPMIPQGAIAAKQFLLHVSGKPLDALSRVQYKDKKQIPESTFLPTATSFLGSANDWIQVYDDVATTALECCRRFFFHDIENPHLVQLLVDLKRLFEEDKLEVWDIPLKLRSFSERRELITNPGNTEVIKFLEQKNEYAAQFLISMGQTFNDKGSAAEQCARFLTRGVDLNNSGIQELQQIIDKQDSENWRTWMLSKLKETNDPIYEAIKKTIGEWNPSTIFRTHGIDQFDYSDVGISKMDEAWDTHFLRHMSPFQSNKNFAKLRKWTLDNYRHPISYYELTAAIDPENSVNDKDPLAKWAISYILDKHPLRNY